MLLYVVLGSMIIVRSLLVLSIEMCQLLWFLVFGSEVCGVCADFTAEQLSGRMALLQLQVNIATTT